MTTPWVVLKFGGTSVSSASNWRNIAAVVRARLATSVRVLVVHSALSGITDRLEQLLTAALAGTHEPLLRGIEQRHLQLASELGLDASEQLQHYFLILRQISSGIALTSEVSDRTRARVLATGELMATELGASYLNAQGIATQWWDARGGLRAQRRADVSERVDYLFASCDFELDPALQAQLAAVPGVILTQGFIAGDAEGDTVLLGRGGSDTSAAYFAAKLGARALEIWTDVPGMFSANPRSTPQARLLSSLHYDEAQEIASSGAKILHPRSILPAKSRQIPIAIYATQWPELPGTHIDGDGLDGAAQVKAVCIKKGITLVVLDSPGMWHQVGFLADAFQVFKRHGLSVDLISTSETNVTVSLDPAANALDERVLERLILDLSPLCDARLIGPCASVSLVGRNIRAILHQLGEAFELFADQRVYLLNQAANDLNFTFVVDEDQGDRLVEQLHERLIRPVRANAVLGPTWQQLFAPKDGASPAAPEWWRTRREALLQLALEHDCAYVYAPEAVRSAAAALRTLKAVDRVLYSMKANPHPDILRLLAEEGIGFECVSRGEIEHLLACLPQLARQRILFTPNFAPFEEYLWALEQQVTLTLDNLELLASSGERFRGRNVFVRVDTGAGRGHHHHVRTAGTHAKFGVPLERMDEIARLSERCGVNVVGLHAHSGSGIFDVDNWSQVAAHLLAWIPRFPRLQAIDVGGGLGVPDSSQQPELDLRRLDSVLLAAKQSCPGVEFWIEPGRYLVATAGVLLARVTQIKSKDDVHYVGLTTGMNSLIRPALYGAWHEIVNLTRLHEPATLTANVVGPICESADFLGHDRLLPRTEPGDVMLIANVGAYGHSMSSHYNLRAPAVELLLP